MTRAEVALFLLRVYLVLAVASVPFALAGWYLASVI
jgi:hypothetical protein